MSNLMQRTRALSRQRLTPDDCTDCEDVLTPAQELDFLRFCLATNAGLAPDGTLSGCAWIAEKIREHHTT